jgi:hypothetical protein
VTQRYICLGLLLGCFVGTSATAASTKDIAQGSVVAVLIGQSAACGLASGERAATLFGIWMDKKFPPGSKDQIEWLPKFADMAERATKQQAANKSASTCSDVDRTLRSEKFKKSLEE